MTRYFYSEELGTEAEFKDEERDQDGDIRIRLEYRKDDWYVWQKEPEQYLAELGYKERFYYRCHGGGWCSHWSYVRPERGEYGCALPDPNKPFTGCVY